MKVLNRGKNMAWTKSESVNLWVDNSFKNQTKVSCKEHTYWATFIIWAHWNQGYPKHSKFAITDIREKPVHFFYCSTRASTLVSAITLLTQVNLQKFPFLFIFIIPWFNCSTTFMVTFFISGGQFAWRC